MQSDAGNYYNNGDSIGADWYQSDMAVQDIIPCSGSTVSGPVTVLKADNGTGRYLGWTRPTVLRYYGSQ